MPSMLPRTAATYAQVNRRMAAGGQAVGFRGPAKAKAGEAPAGDAWRGARAFEVLRSSIYLCKLLAAVLWSLPAMAIEEPAYTVVEREAPFEVRDYRSYVVAETFVEGSFGEVGNEGFQRLFRYISGDNRAAEKISMTAPVEQAAAPTKIAMTAPVEQQPAGGRWRIAFVLPASYTLETAPRPTDDRVALAEVPPRRMVVVSYRGGWSEARYDEELAAVRRFVAERGLAAVGEPVFARFDPPFMPSFLRRNEIQIPVRSPPAR
jgi:hypothetical protein